MSINSDEAHERRRIAALRETGMLDTPPDDEFDALTRLVRTVCQTPFALISLVDAERQWFKSKLGLTICETSRDASFCSVAIEEPHAQLVVTDTWNDPRFRSNPLVLGEPFVRFYAGSALCLSDGYAIGSLCVLDRRPRTLEPHQLETLGLAANAVTILLERRRTDANLHTLQIASAAALHRSDILAAGLDHANDAVVVVKVDRSNPSDARIFHVNTAFLRLSGYASSGILGRNIDVLYGSASDRAYQENVLDTLQRGGSTVREISISRKDGSIVNVEASSSPIAFDPDAAVTYVVAVLHDLTQRHLNERRAIADAESRREVSVRLATQREFERAAEQDGLTGLPNRTPLLRRLTTIVDAIREGRIADDRVALLFIEIDQFRRINDVLGHTQGDELLVEAAERIRESIRDTDVLARVSGSGFIVLIEREHDRAETTARLLADRIAERLSASSIRMGHSNINVTTSIGIVVVGDRDAEGLLHDAEIALSQARLRGGGRVQAFHPALREHVIASATLEIALLEAIGRNEFALAYQPIVSLRDGERRVEGFESLLRWARPGHGLLEAGSFIETAESSGLIVQLGEWILYEACRQLHTWQRLPFGPAWRPKVSVNISAQQLVQTDLVAIVRRVIDETGIDARGLALELTESSIIGDVDEAIATFRRLREMGVALHLDDFGTGYSSLSYLRRLGVDRLKIDRSFVSTVGTDAIRDGEIVGAVIDLGHRLGIEIVAEGVESEQQYRELRRLSCDFGQGYFFSKPIDANRATEFFVSDARRFGGGFYNATIEARAALGA